MRNLILLVGLLVLGVAQPQAPPTATIVAPQIEALMARFMADANVVGASVGVVRGNDTIVRRGWGLADRNAKLPVTPETTFRIGSVSKQFTAALVMRLVERGRVALDDLAEAHLPQMLTRWRGVTVRQLLNHTSGVPEFETTSTAWKETMTPAELVGRVSHVSLRFKPGTKFEYSNTNYVLLGMLAEKYYAKPIAQILDEEIARPLGLTSTRYCEDAYGANGQTRPYERDGDRVKDAPYRSVSHSFGAGGVCSTLADVAAWNLALHTGKVVNAASYALMTTPSGAAEADKYGFGLYVQQVQGRSSLFHTGLTPGFITINAWIPSERLSLTVFMNTYHTPQASMLFRDVARMAMGLPVSIMNPVAGPPPDAATLRRYTGTYTILAPGKSLDVRIWVDGKTLMSQAAGQKAAPLRPVGPDMFGTPDDWTIRWTFTVDKGVTTRCTLEQGGSQFEGVKKK